MKISTANRIQEKRTSNRYKEKKDRSAFTSKADGLNLRKVNVVPEVTTIQVRAFAVITNAITDRFSTPNERLYRNANAKEDTEVKAR